MHVFGLWTVRGIRSTCKLYTKKRPGSELTPQPSCLFAQPPMLDIDLYSQFWWIVSLDLVDSAHFAWLRHQQAAEEGVVLFR